jgi:2-dehydropantoate 2-reductase
VPDGARDPILQTPPRVLIAGAGALGSVYGAHLALGGADVTLLARPAHADAIMRQGGLRLEDASGTRTVPLSAVSDPRAIEQTDILILLTKAPDTLQTLKSLDHVRSGLSAALSLQNGVLKDEQLASWVGAEKVVGAVSLVGGSLVEAGYVRRTVTGPTYLGDLQRTTTGLSGSVAQLMHAGQLPVEVTDRIDSASWSKLAQAVAAMSLSVFSRRYFHELLLDEDLAAGFVSLVQEVAAVADASGVSIDDWAGMMPVRSLATLPLNEALLRLRTLGEGLVARGETSIRISMLQSLERAAPLEAEAIQVFVAERAQDLGVAAPQVTLAAHVIRALERVRSDAPLGSDR